MTYRSLVGGFSDVVPTTWASRADVLDPEGVGWEGDMRLAEGPTVLSRTTTQVWWERTEAATVSITSSPQQGSPSRTAATNTGGARKVSPTTRRS
jgi:hypothetical protein